MMNVPAHAAIEEVIVTATKREESLQDVPVAVTALKGDDLEELRIGTFQDYVQFLPNVSVQGSGPGQNEIFIRGAATAQSVISLSSVQGLQPSVALYQDEQPVAMQGRNLDIYATDLERVEVLPGPQGTLFGASSQAGTVRLITNKPVHGEFQAGFDSSIADTRGGDMSHSVEAYLNLPVTEALAVRVAVYNDHQGGWIDNILNDPANGGWSGSAVVLNRISGGPMTDPVNSPPALTIPRNDAFVEGNFNDATYTGGRFGVSYLINDDWDVLVQHTRQSLESEGVFAYDANLAGDSSVNRFNPDENDDDFGLTTWTFTGRLAMLDVVYTGGYLDREVNASIDYTWYTNGGLFAAYYVCYPTYDTQCFDPSKFYREDTENTRMTHELRFATPEDKRMRLTAGVFYDDQELASVGQFKIASTDNPFFGALSRTLVGTDGINSNGGPFGPEISFVNDITQETEQIALFGQVEFDVLPDVTAAFGARWYDIDNRYRGSTTTADVSARLQAFGTEDPAALTAVFGAAEAANVLAAIASGQLDVDDLNSSGVLNASDVIFRASLDWRATDEILLFATFAQGFRPPVTNRLGGDAPRASTGPFANFRIPVSSQTDDLDNFELGFKADLFNYTLRLNVTGFYSEISDLQTSRFDPTNVSFLWFADNVGDAEIIGADGDFIWAPTDNLTIAGAFSVIDTEITRLNPELQGIAPPVGSELPLSADFSANVRARYDFEIPALSGLSGLLGYITGSVSYTGESLTGMKMDAFVQEDTTQRVFGRGSGLKIKREADDFAGAPAGTDLLNEPNVPGGRYIQDDYVLVNLGLGVTRAEWTAEFFLDNVFDENAALHIDTQQFTPKVVTNRPRTFGFRLSYDFN